MNKNIVAAIAGMALLAALAPGRASADVVFEEITSQSGMPMGGGSGNKTKVLISGDKYRAQKKMTMDAGAMADQMKFSQQMSGANMGMMNKINRAGMPDYPDHIMSLDEWAEFEPNAKLIDEVSKASGGRGGKLKQLGKEFSGIGKSIAKSPIGGLFGKKKEEKPQKTVGDIIQKYCSELDAGILEKKKDEAAEKMSQEGGMGFVELAQVTDYDTWLRAKIIRGYCGGRGGGDRSDQALASAAGFGGKGGGGGGGGSLDDIQKVSDDKSPEYAEQKRQAELKSEYKAEYAKAKEKSKKIAGAMEKQMGEGMKGMAEELGDMMLSVQIIRLDTGKVIELFPPQKAKDPKPEDVTYKEESLDDVRERVEEQEKKMQKAMKANEGAKKEGEAKMAAMRAKYGDQAIDQATGGKPEAKKIGNETVNGLACEHWQLKGMSGMDDYWVSKKFPGAEEIVTFEAKLKEKTGTGRGGMAFGGMPDMGSMMGGMDPVMDAEVAKIKERGIVIKKVNTMKNAAPSQASMLHNQKVMAGDLGDAGAAQKMQSMSALEGMSAKEKMAMMKDPAAFQKMMGGNKMGEAAQASAEKHQAAGDFKNDDRQDMTSTYELKVLHTNPVPEAAFEPPAGAKKK